MLIRRIKKLNNKNPLEITYTCLNMILLMGKVTLILIKAAPQPQTNSKYSSRFNCMKNAIIADFCQCQLIFSSNIILRATTTHYFIIIATMPRATRLHPWQNSRQYAKSHVQLTYMIVYWSLIMTRQRSAPFRSEDFFAKKQKSKQPTSEC